MEHPVRELLIVLSLRALADLYCQVKDMQSSENVENVKSGAATTVGLLVVPENRPLHVWRDVVRFQQPETPETLEVLARQAPVMSRVVESVSVSSRLQIAYCYQAISSGGGGVLKPGSSPGTRGGPNRAPA